MAANTPRPFQYPSGSERRYPASGSKRPRRSHGEDPSEQSVAAGDGDCRPDAGDERRQRLAGENDTRRRERGDVEEDPFGLEDSALRDAPGARRCDPERERRECRDRRDLEPAKLDVGEDDPDDDHPHTAAIVKNPHAVG